MEWKEENEALLRRLWSEKASASEIADAVGATRDEVASEAKRLGLTAPDASLPRDDVTAADPIFALAGASTTVAALQNWRWPSGGARYIDRDVSRALDNAASGAAARSFEDPVVTAADLVEAVLATPFAANKSRTLKKVASRMLSAGIDMEPASRTAARRFSRKIPDAKLRWDAVAILAESAGVRARTMVGRGTSDYHHLMAALLSSQVGQRAVREVLPAELARGSFRRAVVELLSDTDLRRGVPAAWQTEIARLDAPSGVPSLQRAGFASDRVAAGGDVFGTSSDAQALADLILLEAAAPPLAIGLFGSWGSGKSTMIAELKREIEQQIENERMHDGDAPTVDPGLARVTGVMQLEFNAWTFADSENLWASLTAELFDQIAAGGSDKHRSAEGARLVREVAARVGREANALTIARMKLDESTGAITAARKAITNAKEESGGLATIVDAMGETFDDMMKPAKEGGEDGTSHSKKPHGQDKEAENGLKAVREALLIDPGQTGAEIARKYAQAASPMRRHLSFVTRWSRGRSARQALRTTALLAIPFVLLVCAWIFQAPIVAGLPPLPSRLAGLATFIPPVWVFARTWLLPAWRGASLVNKKYEEVRQRSAAALATARRQLRESKEARREAEEAIERGEPIVDRYGSGPNTASPPPSMMLEYLLKDSADVTELKGRLGTLGTVRRCFSQLNHVIEQLRLKGDADPVQRIVIYIDDLDRCSEQQVVQVLEAIHLMLAFPCFVVVAAVDVRWLQAALRSQHQAMAGEDALIDPADYLEKIFQIPFWVRTLSTRDVRSSGYVDYVRALLNISDDEDRSAEGEDEEEDDADRPFHNDGRHSAFPRLEPMRPVADRSSLVAGRQLKLTPREVVLIEAMQPLAARSPRAVKRMINIYRLIRVSISEDQLDDYLGEGRNVAPYWSVILALAWETGLRASEMTDLVQDLQKLGQEDFETVVGHAVGIFDEVVVKNTSSATAEVMRLVTSPAGHALGTGLTIAMDHDIRLDHKALSRGIETVSRYSFRLQ